jgi:NAD(P)-dependent dehydrogenase (short-subunit alcohol dehydrogenase family)
MRKRRKGIPKGALVVAGIGLGLVAREMLARRHAADLSGEVVLVTGGSRGLGFLIAREFARQGCRVAICARDPAELEQARADLAREDAAVVAVTCDVADPQQVGRLVDEVTRRCGRIDVLVNNAGVIQVGPAATMTLDDFRQALDVMYWGMVYPTLAVLPQMRARRSGRIVNVTSIGGKASVPHLLPYSSAKYAATGFSEGLRAELARDGIQVTTIVPGLMRTGSHLHAQFKPPDSRVPWFPLGASLPFISMDAERAARQVVEATRRGEAERVLGLPYSLFARFQGAFPGLTADLFGLANRLMPAADGSGAQTIPGMALRERWQATVGPLMRWGESAARRFHQYPEPVSAADAPVITRRSA